MNIRRWGAAAAVSGMLVLSGMPLMAQAREPGDQQRTVYIATLDVPAAHVADAPVTNPNAARQRTTDDTRTVADIGPVAIVAAGGALLVAMTITTAVRMGAGRSRD